MNATLAFSTVCLIVGGLLIARSMLSPRRPALTARLNRLGQAEIETKPAFHRLGAQMNRGPWLDRARERYTRALRVAGDRKTVDRLLAEKAAFAGAVPLIVLMLYTAAAGRLPSTLVLLLVASIGFFIPDIALRAKQKSRCETIFIDLPEAVSVMALGLGAGQSLRQAVELAARDCPGPLAEDLGRALTLARRERGIDERQALVRVAFDSGEPAFARFAELLAAKESPYLEFLRGQSRQMREEQARYLERAADRAYLAMHAPLAPLLAVMVLLLAYGFLHVLSQSI